MLNMTTYLKRTLSYTLVLALLLSTLIFSILFAASASAGLNITECGSWFEVVYAIWEPFLKMPTLFTLLTKTKIRLH